MLQDIHFQRIEHNSEDYFQSVRLRQEILRTPLGLVFTKDDLTSEALQIHIVGKSANRIVCTASILIFQQHCKIRQVAVQQNLQKTGIGYQLMTFCERYIQQLNIAQIELHARLSIADFYRKMGYTEIGDGFIEVNLPHIKMVKYLK